MPKVALRPSLCWLRACLMLHVATVLMLCTLVANPYVALLGMTATLWHLVATTALAYICIDPETWHIVHHGVGCGVLSKLRDAKGDGQCVPLARFSHVYLFQIEWSHGQRQSLWVLRDALPPAAFSRLAMQWWVAEA
jgi:hypothetical protein